MSPRLYAAVGAFGCGKTTTLAWLARHHGVGIHAEAHNAVIAELGSRTLGHPEDAPWARIDDPSHLCGICTPVAFGQRVLERQFAIEQSASEGDFVDHGWLDAIDYVAQRAGAAALAQLRVPVFAPYRRVFLFEVMPELQRERWGRSRERRVEEARAANRRLEALYRGHGLDVVSVQSGTVEERAERVLARLREHGGSGASRLVGGT